GQGVPDGARPRPAGGGGGKATMGDPGVAGPDLAADALGGRRRRPRSAGPWRHRAWLTGGAPGTFRNAPGRARPRALAALPGSPRGMALGIYPRSARKPVGRSPGVRA